MVGCGQLQNCWFLGLETFHKFLGNWGWSIILLTVVVKMILWPLSAKSYRSMAKMRVIAPEIQRMKEEFGEDRVASLKK